MNLLLISKKNINILTTVVFLISTLSSCSLMPGQTLSLKNNPPINSDDNNLNWENLINLYNITPKLIETFKTTPITPKRNKELEKEINNYVYQVGIGDILSIIIWEHPELTTPSGQYRSSSESGQWVDEKGFIFFPYIGKVNVLNNNLNEIREKLTFKLSKYLENPQVDVKVADFRSKKVYITGQVKKPGNQKITNIPLTVLDAINFAEGVEENADWENITLTRNEKDIKISLYNLMHNGDMTENYLLQDNDILYIPRNDQLKVFVMGEVGQQNTLTIDRGGMTLAEAITRSSGINQQLADASGIFVIRQALDDPQGKIANIYQLNARNVGAMVLATEFQLKAYDIVYVTTAPVVRWNRLINQLTPTITNIHSLIESIKHVKQINK